MQGDDQGHRGGRPAATPTPPLRTPSAPAGAAPSRSSTTSPPTEIISSPAPGGGAVATADNPATPPTSRRRSTATRSTASYQVGHGLSRRLHRLRRRDPQGDRDRRPAETEYMVTSQNNLIDGCCFDYGNAETDSHDDGNGTMEAVYFGGGVVWGTGSPGGHNNGPWVDGGSRERPLRRMGKQSGPEHRDQHAAQVQLRHGRGRRRCGLAERGKGALRALWRRRDHRHSDRPSTTGSGPPRRATSRCTSRGRSSSGSAATTATATGENGSKASWPAAPRRLATLNSVQANIVAAEYGK